MIAIAIDSYLCYAEPRVYEGLTKIEPKYVYCSSIFGNEGSNEGLEIISATPAKASSEERDLKRVVSYSLYGSDVRYLGGMMSSIHQARRALPGWITRIYHDGKS